MFPMLYMGRGREMNTPKWMKRKPPKGSLAEGLDLERKRWDAIHEAISKSPDKRLLCLYEAAPDLLSACEAFLKAWEGPAHMPDMVKVIQKMNEAIQKAKGGKS